MPDLHDVHDILDQQHIAFVGVSTDPKAFASTVYRAMRDRGRTMYPVNRHADATLEGDPAFARLADVPDPVDAVVVMVPADQVADVVRDALARGIPRVWLHRGAGQGPPAPEAVAACREAGVVVVDGACPLMFDGDVRGVHRWHRWMARRRFAAA